MKLGPRIRELRKRKGYTLRELAAKVNVGFTYLCKIETGKLDPGHAPSEALIHKVALELDADENELLTLAERIPPLVRQRFLERSEDFFELANLDDETLSDVMRYLRESEFSAH